MENRKRLMNRVLCDCLRELMLGSVFEKITIKQICDKAGVIRATFYNYYDDKYDCLNSILYHDLVETMSIFEDEHSAILKMEKILAVIEENLAFYQAAYKVEGQNSFESMLKENLSKIYRESFSKRRRPQFYEVYSNELLADYYAEASAFVIRKFVFRKDGVESIEDARRLILVLTSNSFIDFIQYPEKKS